MTGVDAYVKGPADSTDPLGKKIDNDVLTIGADDVYRQRTRMAGAAAAELADVRNADPAAGDYGIVARIVGTVPLPTGAGTEASLTLIDASLAQLDTSLGLIDASISELTLDQGSTTEGQTGPLVMGAVTEQAPFYEDAETFPLSLTRRGHLRTEAPREERNLSALMFTVLEEIRDELRAMNEVMQEAFEYDTKAALAKKGGRHFTAPRGGRR